MERERERKHMDEKSISDKHEYSLMAFNLLTRSPKWFIARVNPNSSALALC